MNKGIYPLAASMINQLYRVDTISNNLANTNTTGFKEDNLIEGSFNSYLNSNPKYDNDNIIDKLSVTNNTIPKIDGHFVNDENGYMLKTDNLLDFAINKRDLFFKVENENKEILLTKNGNFKSLNGFLVTAQGYNVLDINNKKIEIDDEFDKRISLVQTEFKNIDKQGNNNYRIKKTNEVKPIIDNESFLLQGTIEKSNINAVSSMIELIDAQRRLEQAQKASTGIDEINQKMINKIIG